VGTPKLHQLVFSITPDAGVRYQKLKTGECHVIAYPSPADLPSIEANPALRIEKKSGLNLSYLAMNTEKPPFNQALVRQAIAHALNKDSYIRAIYLGNAKKAISLYPDSVWSYDHSMTDYEFDPKKAKQLLAQAGYPNGFHTTLWTLPVTRAFNPNGKKMGEMMQKDLAAIGIQVKLMTFDWSTYLEKARLGEQEMMQLGWSGDTGDPDNFMYPLLSCDSVTRGSNNSRFCDKEFDRLIIAARTEKNQDIRAGLYQKAQRRLKEQTPIIPIAHAMVYRAVSDRVLGFELDSLDRERFFDIDLKAL
jgi:dipeptide transport system substrate-binding protein